MREISVNGATVQGGKEEVLSELAFAHYPVRVDAGEGEKEFDSFDEAKAYVLAVCDGENGE